MNADLVIMAVLAGGANWAFRALPTLLLRSAPRPGGRLAGFLAATGPAAIATLFVASVLPALVPAPRDVIPYLAGVAATITAFMPRKSVVAATLSGAAAFGLAFALAN